MKTKFLRQCMVCAALVSPLHGQTEPPIFTNFIRQVQLPDSGVQMDVWVPAAGQRESPLEINPTGARFELHTVRSDTFESFLMDTRYVGSYVPLADIVIRTEDINSATPRTRADRPFYVDVIVSGLRSGAEDPEASKSVKFLHHTQSYGDGGDGVGIDRTLATLASQVSIRQNATHRLTYTLTNIAGANRAKIRGEERFSVFSLADFRAPESQIASQTVQIWPIADGTISGIESGSTIQFTAPALTISAFDLYPDSRLYAQVYQGNKRDDGHIGTVVPGSAVAINEPVPQNRLLSVTGWDHILTADGIWTMELLTFTPFGIDRLYHVTFNVDRKITVNASTTTID